MLYNIQSIFTLLYHKILNTNAYVIITFNYVLMIVIST